MLEKRWQRGKFFRRQKFAPLLKQIQKSMMPGGGNLFEKSIFSAKIYKIVPIILLPIY
jgi:hypothetical protein